MYRFNPDIIDGNIIIPTENILSIERDRDYMTIEAYVSKDIKLKENKGKIPKKYIINKNATILIWKDGTKTVVKRRKEDNYNKKLGFLIAYFQKNSGLTKTQANRYLNNLVEMEV